MTSTQPLDWIRQIDAQLAELDTKPQFEIPTPLNWQELEQNLQSILHRPLLTLTHVSKGWVAHDQILAGMGKKPIPLTIEWTPLSAPAFFVTDEQTFKDVMADLFVSEAEASSFYDAELVEGFSTYFAAEILRLIAQQEFATPLTPRLGPTVDLQKALGDESCFAIDVSLQLGGKNLWGRILLSETFRDEWKTYFAHLGPPKLSVEMQNKLMVELGLEVGHCDLRFEEWKKVKNGDFILLDHCSYDPGERKGAVMLTLQQKPVFRGRLKEGAVKITGYPVHEEVSDMMEEDPFRREFGSKDDADDLYGDLSEDDESELDEDEELFGKLEEEKSAESSGTSSITPEELPVHLTVEVGRVRMTAGALMNLTPGNLLELSVTPEQGVDLVINGKKVGRGELIRMGDVLGVRIISLWQ